SFGQARHLAEIQVCPGRVFCPRLPKPERSRNRLGRLQQKYAGWEQSRFSRATTVVKTGSPGLDCAVENHLHFRDHQSDYEVSRRLGWVSNGVEWAEELYQYE